MDEFLEVLAELSIPEDYSPIDRYHDFRKVFLDNEQGRRVLKQIFAWGNILRTPLNKHPIDPNRIIASEGERRLALQIFATMMIQPTSRKPTQMTTPKGDDYAT